LIRNGEGGFLEVTRQEREREFFDFALDLTREAGSRLRSGYGSVERDEVGYKGWRNLVTRFDLEVERMVVERIIRAYPEHGILAEEGVAREGSSPYRWVIDPLDGTTNYVHRHPMYCVSIALEDQSGGVLGVVYAPHLDELFTARRGQGALFNLVRPLRVSQEGDLSRALLASGFAYREGELVNTNLENWSRLSLVCRGLRRCGAAALDLAYVADGRYDGFWELYLSPWDIAAGALLVTEAGGRVTDIEGGSAWSDGSSVLASNGLLHQEIRGQLNGS
jgi:myo-inositol-1(or 4)-monophosphatase